MNNFNQGVISKLVDYIKRIIGRIEASSNRDVSIQLVKYNVIDAHDLDVTYLTSRGMTGTMTIKFFFKIVDNKTGHTIEYSEDLDVPKMINGVFVIEGTLRIPTNTLDNDDIITVYANNIKINDMINIEYKKIKGSSELDVDVLIYEDEDPTHIPFTEEAFRQNADKLKLTQEEVDKIKVKLDTDQVSSPLTVDIVQRLIDRGPDKLHDQMIDKKIHSPESNFIKYLWARDNRSSIQRNMKKKFYQTGKVFLRDIQYVITRYFKIASEDNIDFPSSINPLVFDSLKGKIRIPSTVAYNISMTDIIDVSNTPINGNVNHINELNVCAEVIDDVIHIKCYKYPSQEPVTVPYTHYCTKKVLVNQYWDYNLKKFASDDPKIQYRLRSKIREGTKDIQFDYIEPTPEDKLSLTSRRIPMGNMSDSIRLSMATAMAKQSVELVNSEPPLVGTGHDDSDLEYSTFTTRSHLDGATVDKITKDKVFLKTKDGSVEYIEIPGPTMGMNEGAITFQPQVKVGDVLKKGDAVVTPSINKRNSYELGSNAQCIYMNYLGMTHEDSFVISKSFADKFLHMSIITVTEKLYADDLIGYIRKIGSSVKSLDVLVNNRSRPRVSDSVKASISSTGLLRGLGVEYKQSNLTVPNNFDEGYVVNVKFQMIPGRQLTQDVTNQLISEFEKNRYTEDYESIPVPKHYRDLKIEDITDYGDKEVGFVTYKLVRFNRAKIGDKMANRYGSKGVIGLILPDECMPQIEYYDGTRVSSDVLVNPGSVISRKNMSQIVEVSLSKCIRAIYRKVDNFIKNDQIPSALKFLEQFYGTKFTAMGRAEFLENHKQGIVGYKMGVGFFSSVTPDKLKEWMTILGVKDTEKIFIPDVTLAETEKGLIGIPLDRSFKDGKNIRHFELGYTDQESVTGDSYMLKLYHAPEYKGKVNVDDPTTYEPIMGRGKYRIEGQKIGEMETWILLETGTEKFLLDRSKEQKLVQYNFLNELLMAGYTISDVTGNPVLSESKTKADRLKQLGL